MRAALLVLLLGVAPASAQQTKNLGLLLGSQGYENQNWQLLDQVLCQTPGTKLPCTNGGGVFPAAAVAPFACAAATDGVYTDTDCNQVCTCNPSQARWCRSDTGVCGSATDCCLAPGATSTTTTTTSTTTTTLANPAPDWTASFLGVWPLDEACGTRVSMQGTVTRNLKENPAPVAGNAVTFMEGTGSLQSTPGKVLQTTDATLAALAGTFSCVVWARAESPAAGRLVQNVSGGTNGWFIDVNGTVPGQYSFGWLAAGAPANLPGFPSAVGTWVHVGISNKATGGGSCNIYRNGVNVNSALSCTVGGPDGTQPFTVGGTTTFTGELDELACTNTQITDADVCRICSCGIDGKRCSCSGTSYTVSGRNAASCAACTLPPCNQATP